MASRNDITGDSLTTKSATDSYRNGWDRIFGKKDSTVKNVAETLGRAGETPEDALRLAKESVQKNNNKKK